MSGTIDGPAGALELRTDAPEGRSTALAVLCHPHPQYGGSMHDAVLDTLATTLLARGTRCVRFNFRGVGRSAGRFDGGVGEREDVLAVVCHARETHGPLPLLLAGYSFGAAMAWKAARAADPQALLLVAPPVGAMAFEETDAPACPVDIVVGALDDFAPEAAVRAFHDGLPRAGALSILPGCDHFFSGADGALARAVLQPGEASG